jgi:xanthine dehydrogenase accessory factor
MRADLLQLAADLARRRDAFALAVVVRREPASSARQGDTAIVTAAGQVYGWLGGSCIQPTVVREALAAIRDEAPRLVAFSPRPGSDERRGVTIHPMTCHSGGSVDIYVEPVLPAPDLVVFGLSPVALALTRLGRTLGYEVTLVDPDADPAAVPHAHRVCPAFRPDDGETWPALRGDRLFVVVATQGQRDEEATRAALAARPAYLGIVASRARFAQIRETLAAGGVPAASLDAVRSPAGLDIGARTAEEIALSILAEIVQRRGAAAAHQAPQSATVEGAAGRETRAARSGGAAAHHEGDAAAPTAGAAADAPDSSAGGVFFTMATDAVSSGTPDTRAETARSGSPAVGGTGPAGARTRVAPAEAATAARAPEPEAATEAIDPVCGMTVAVAAARHRAEHAGHVYYFCCGGCRERFLVDPARYVAAAR